MRKTFTLKQIAEDFPIAVVQLGAVAPWFIKRDFADKYDYRNGKSGDTFYDGNNGDRWVVRAANVKFNRLIVENKTQGGLRIVVWEV